MKIGDKCTFSLEENIEDCIVVALYKFTDYHYWVMTFDDFELTPVFRTELS